MPSWLSQATVSPSEITPSMQLSLASTAEIVQLFAAPSSESRSAAVTSPLIYITESSAQARLLPAVSSSKGEYTGIPTVEVTLISSK